MVYPEAEAVESQFLISKEMAPAAQATGAYPEAVPTTAVRATVSTTGVTV